MADSLSLLICRFNLLVQPLYIFQQGNQDPEHNVTNDSKHETFQITQEKPKCRQWTAGEIEACECSWASRQSKWLGLFPFAELYFGAPSLSLQVRS
jgi:hypothetical protein